MAEVMRVGLDLLAVTHLRAGRFDSVTAPS